jgi:hypothetical protein
MGEHSKLGASGMYRWSACPGSVKLCETVPPAVESAYAAEGTKAHEYAAGILTGAVGNAFYQEDQEMQDAVMDYVELCRSYMAHPGAQWWVEKKFDLSKVYPGCFGTSDFVCYWPDHKKLIVDDFKYGSGIWIDPKDNPQLMYYGLGAVLDLNLPDIETVELGICQPRCGDGQYRCVEVSITDLMDFRVDLAMYALATEVPDAQLTPGEHCRFCPASGVCPALQQRATDVAKLEFAPPTYDPGQLAQALAMRETLKAFIKGVDEFAYAELSAGREIPGWKLVEKRATRKWKDGESPATMLKAAGYSDGAIYQPKQVLSPAQLEKTNKDAYKTVEAFVVKESSGCTVVPESDKREAVKRITAQEEFSVDIFA